MEYFLENELLRVTINSFGAELTSIRKKETGEELLWQADPAVWNRHAPILFPYCGKLKDGKFTHKGVTYAGGQHGFARDMEYALHAQSGGEISLCLEANALTMEKYPFAFKLITTYHLAGTALHHTISVLNDGDEPMHFGVGYHPGINCPFDRHHTIADYSFVFDTPETPAVIETGKTSGLVTGKTEVYCKNETVIPITDHLFDGDSICFKGLQSKTLSVVEAGSGRRVTFDIAGYPYVLIWSAKGPVQFVCVEPWFGLPDPENATGEWNEKPAVVTLCAGGTWNTELVIHFDR
ncbi:MAG: aldose 1-epimerase family protein [Ruthenibacterium sp.]